MRNLTILLLCSLLGGCGYLTSWVRGSDNTVPPAELTSIAAPITIDTLWQRQASSGTGALFIHLVPVVVGGRVFVAGHEGDISSLDATTGQTLWQVDTEQPISAGVGFGDGLVLVGTINGEVIALDAVDGSERWRKSASSEILAAPQASDGVVVVRTVDGNFTGLDAATGERRWGYSYTVPALTLRGTSAPLAAQGVAITGLDTGKLVVLALENGVPVWERVVAPPRGRTEMDRLVDIDGTPVIVGNILYAAAFQGNVTAIDLRSGNTLWNRDFSSHNGLGAGANQVFLTDENDAVWSLDARTGGSLWRQDGLTGRQLTAPTQAGNYVVVGDFEGYLHWLDDGDGQLRGRVRLDNDGITATPVAVTNTVFVLDDSGQLSAFRAGG